MSGAEGRFVVLEGIDGSGTTTQAKRLAAELERRGTRVCLTCEPSSGPIGVLIRQALGRKLPLTDGGAPRAFDWSTLALLFAADRLDHVDSVVLPALREGKTVVSDRYDLSSLAYQSVTAPEGDGVVPWIRELNRRARRPDLTLVLDVEADVAERRRALRGGPPEIFEVSEIQRRLAEVYARAAELVPGDRLVHVPDGTPDDVADRILSAVLAV
jgi:dTMP kinase